MDLDDELFGKTIILDNKVKYNIYIYIYIYIYFRFLFDIFVFVFFEEL